MKKCKNKPAVGWCVCLKPPVQIPYLICRIISSYYLHRFFKTNINNIDHFRKIVWWVYFCSPFHLQSRATGQIEKAPQVFLVGIFSGSNHSPVINQEHKSGLCPLLPANIFMEIFSRRIIRYQTHGSLHHHHRIANPIVSLTHSTSE